MSNRPYLRFPTIHGDQIVFCAEDDLWTVSTSGGTARRLTTSLDGVSRPLFSPDGQNIAFGGRDDGSTEVYIMPAEGGEAQRLTHTGAATRIMSWSQDGAALVFGSSHTHPFGLLEVYEAPIDGSPITPRSIGHAASLSFGPGGRCVMGRLNADSARWKRYRGGTAGDLWIDNEGQGQFQRLIDLKGNLCHPLWVGDRIYFVSDHEGVGNIYSVLPTGESLKRHTSFKDFYVRWPSAQGGRIVFHVGAELHILDCQSGDVKAIEVTVRSTRSQRQRKFASAQTYLEAYDVHPQGHSLTISTRGRAFSFNLWEGAVKRYHAGDGRQRKPSWLHDGERIAAFVDRSGEEKLAISNAAGEFEEIAIEGDFGRPIEVAASPVDDFLAITNHRYELYLIDIAAGKATQIDKSPMSRISEINWAPDGRWIAYSCAVSESRAELRVVRVEEDGSTRLHAKTKPVLADDAPSFTTDGRYLIFLAQRHFDPVYDDLHFSLGFPKAHIPCLIPLTKDLPSPFEPRPRAPGEPAKAPGEEKAKKDDEGDKNEKGEDESKNKNRAPEPVKIDAEGFAERVLAFPIEPGRFVRIKAGDGGKILMLRARVDGALGSRWDSTEPPADRDLLLYDLEELEEKTLCSDITSFRLGNGGKTLVIRKGNKLRAVKLSDKLPKEGKPGRKSGGIDLGRVRVPVDPAVEWPQMLREAWRLQRDHFWDPKMSNIDWQGVFDRYRPLLDRVTTRTEFSDLVWMMQGELGTSHAYEMGGDHRKGRSYPLGQLGADIAWDGEGWRIEHIVRGDSWNAKASSPLAAPGINVCSGQYILSVDGSDTSRMASPASLMVNLGGCKVELGISEAPKGERRLITVTCARSEAGMRYREWVEGNRATIHEATDGKVGYVHIPDMGPAGFAEFFRGYIAESDRLGLIVDARFNRGGHVSQLLLEKLARRRLGYDIQRHGEAQSYPAYSVVGPIVGLTNEYAGSDGDIFSHSFKMLKLGTLIGTRTWGGVIGIHPRERLTDGSFTTQPEFSFWFNDVGYGVENYGTDPDILVEIPPHESGDPQLEKAVAVALAQLEETPPQIPNFDGGVPKPDLSAPSLNW